MKSIMCVFYMLIALNVSGCEEIIESQEIPVSVNENTFSNEILDQAPDEAADIKNIIIEDEFIDTIYIKVNDHTLSATLIENSATQYLIKQLLNGDITIQMNDYGGFEKVGSFGFSLPTNNEQIDTSLGDLILYQGNTLVIFYDSNSWNYTRLGKVNDDYLSELETILGKGDATVTLSIKNN